MGSVHQHFPNKHAIYVALHERHLADIDRAVGSTLIDHANSDLKTLLRALLNSLIDAYLEDQESLAFLLSEIPHRSTGSQPFAERTTGVLRLIVSARLKNLDAARLTGLVFVLANMIEALSHAALLGRPSTMSLNDAREHGTRAILACVDAFCV